MPIDGVLARIPGYGGYLAKRQYDEQQDSQDLQQMSNAATVFGQLQTQKDAQEIRGVLSAAKTPEDAVKALIPLGSKPALELATHLKGLLAKPQTVVAAGSTVLGPDNKPVFTAPAKPSYEAESPLAKLMREKAALAPDDPNHASYDAAIKRHTDKVGDSAPVGVIGPDGKPVYVNRSDAIGKTPASAQNVGAVVPSQHADLHGSDYLSTLPPGTQNTVKGIADGSIHINAISMRNNQREAMVERVKQYDPTFSMANYQTRLAVQKDFTSGKTSDNVTAINTAIGHIGTLKELGQALSQNDIPAVNAIVNRVSKELGEPGINNYDIASDAIGHELMRVFRQVGATKQESEAWEAKFKAGNSPEQRAGAIKTAVDLLGSRIESVDDKWKRGMGTEQGFPNLLSPKSKAILGSVSGKTAGAMPEFATEDEAAKAGLKPGTKVKIGGKTGTWH